MNSIAHGPDGVQWHFPQIYTGWLEFFWNNFLLFSTIVRNTPDIPNFLVYVPGYFVSLYRDQYKFQKAGGLDDGRARRVQRATTTTIKFSRSEQRL